MLGTLCFRVVVRVAVQDVVFVISISDDSTYRNIDNIEFDVELNRQKNIEFFDISRYL